MAQPNIDDHTILEQVSRISISLLLKEPFYGHFFSSLIKEIDRDCPTMAIGHDSGSIILYINPDFWLYGLPKTEHKYGAIKHEILHVVYKHIIRYSDFSYKELFNIAADLVVNQYISREQLIDEAIFLQTFPELKLIPYQSLNYYYNRLLELLQDYSLHKKMPDAKSNLAKYLDPENSNQKKHYRWQIKEEMQSVENTIAETIIDETIENAVNRVGDKGIGSIPGGVKTYLQEWQQARKSTVHWKRILRLFSHSSRKTQIKNTLRRPSKRYGTTPGIKVKRKQKLLIVIDTSGSVCKNELQEFFQELYSLWKQGARIYVLEADYKIQKEYEFKGSLPQTISGGGGTLFDPAIQYANENYKPDAIIYFTDGYAPLPKTKPIAPILWALSKKGLSIEKFHKYPGRKLKLT